MFLSNIAIFSNLTSTTIKAFVFYLIQDEFNLAILTEEEKHSFVHKVIPSYHQISTVHVKIMITSQWCLIREIFPSYCRRIFAFMDRRIASIIQWRVKL